jgi:hypothetical protein
MPEVTQGDFYEEDEPVEKILAIFEAGEKGLTGAVRGWTATLPAVRLPGRHPLTEPGTNELARAAS